MKAIWEASGPQIAYGQIVTHGLWAGGLFLGWIISMVQMCGSTEAENLENCPSFYGYQPMLHQDDDSK